MHSAGVSERMPVDLALSLARTRATRALAVICPVIVLSLLVPFVLRQNAWLEWSNALWLVERQADSIRATGHPTYFLRTSATGAYYPEYAFYGGSLFAFAGGLAVLIGSAWWALVAMLVLAATSAYGGTLWLARQAGLGLGVASLAATVVATSPYSVTALYGRGAWTEIVATSALPLGLAGALAIARGDRPWAGAAAVAATTAIVAGSHNVTVVWGSIVAAAIGLVAFWAIGADGRRQLARRRVLAIPGALAFGAALASWSFLPAAIYGRQTRAFADGPRFLDALYEFDRLSVILRPYPYVPARFALVNPASYYQIPVYVLAWCLAAVAGALALQRRTSTERRLAVGLCLLLAILLVLTVANGLWYQMPSLLQAIQFPIRIHAYIIVVTAILVIVVLRLTARSRRPRVWLVALVAAVAVQTAFAQYIAWSAPTFVKREAIHSAQVPEAFQSYQSNMYRRFNPQPLRRPRVAVDFGSGGRSRRPALTRSTTRVATNLVVSPFVRVRSPWRIAGTDVDGLAVLVRPSGAVAAPIAEAAWPWPVVLGTTLSLTALGLLASGVVLLVARGVRRRLE